MSEGRYNTSTLTDIARMLTTFDIYIFLDASTDFANSNKNLLNKI